MYLIDHLHEVPVLLVPCVRTVPRLEHQSSFFQASVWGSVIQAVWSFMLALRSRGLGSAWTTLQLWQERETAELLGIPYDEYTQVGLFPIAYTIGTDFQPAQRLPAERGPALERLLATSAASRPARTRTSVAWLAESGRIRVDSCGVLARR